MRRPPTIPVALPVVQIAATGSGVLTVTVDGQPWSTPSMPRPTTDDLPGVLAGISAELGVPVRVEIDVDGHTVTDIVTPEDAAAASAATPHHSAPVPGPGPEPFVFGVIGSGFAPGETVSIAVVVSTCTAADDGVAGLRLPPALLAQQPGPLILLGIESGTVVVSDPDNAQTGAA